MQSQKFQNCAANLVLLVTAATAGAQTAWTCREVIDGDTLTAESSAGRLVRIDIFGIDAPELDQERGADAKAFVEEMVLGKVISFSPGGSDGPEFTASVSVDGKDLAEVLLRAGLAWLPIDGKSTEPYAIALFTARSEQLGLWSDPEAGHPSEWRRRNQRPSPTPKTARRLADIAASIEISGEDGQPVVVADIPSSFTRDRETRLFVEKMVAIVDAVQTLDKMAEVHAHNCSGRSGTSNGESGGSVWSQELKQWVDGSDDTPEEACRALDIDISRGRGLVREAHDEAISSARRFGVKDSVIREVVSYFGLDSR